MSAWVAADNNCAVLLAWLEDSSLLMVVAYAAVAVVAGTIADTAVELKAVVELEMCIVAVRKFDLSMSDVVEASEVSVTLFAQMLVELEPICCSRARCIQVDSRMPSRLS